MHLSSATVQNYKCFKESDSIELNPGFNIFIGQNDAGKTALIESLSLRFSDKPHRSGLTATTSSDILSGSSTVIGTIQLTATDLKSYERRVPNITIPLDAQTVNPNSYQQIINTYNSYLDNGTSLHFVATGLGFENIRLGTDVAAFYNHQYDLLSLKREGHSSAIAEVRGREVALGRQIFCFALAEMLKANIYAFRAERLNVGECAVGPSEVLLPDARNLAQVLNALSSRNAPRYSRFNKHVQEIFPHVTYVSAPIVENNMARIKVWTASPETERDDLAVSLADSGTGIGQVLAILYVLVSSDEPRIILIDEPQSFLHPGAARKLFEIMSKYTQNQYIISTHSPVSLILDHSATTFFVKREELGATLTKISQTNAFQLNDVLSDVGARLSDVFGADRILWVEGKTEETCFPLILRNFNPEKFLGTQIIGVLHTSDFVKKDVSKVVEIHRQLSKNTAFLPPAAGFIFDSENLSDAEKQRILREAGDKFHFLDRRMYENYLIDADAVSDLINEDCPDIVECREKVDLWLRNNSWNDKYFRDLVCLPVEKNISNWLKYVHGASLLCDLVASVSDNRITYRKVLHGRKLTLTILNKKPELLDPIKQILIALY